MLELVLHLVLFDLDVTGRAVYLLQHAANLDRIPHISECEFANNKSTCWPGPQKNT